MKEFKFIALQDEKKFEEELNNASKQGYELEHYRMTVWGLGACVYTAIMSKEEEK